MKSMLTSIILVAIVAGAVWFLTPKSPQVIQPSASIQPMMIETSPRPTEINTITITNFSFSPNVLTVKQGTTVTWVNQDSAPHTIASSTFNSSTLDQGGTFEFTFTSPGTFDYSCSIHPAMKARIIVE